MGLYGSFRIGTCGLRGIGGFVSDGAGLGVLLDAGVETGVEGASAMLMQDIKSTFGRKKVMTLVKLKLTSAY